MRAVLDTTDAAFYLHMTTDALRDLVKHRRVPYKKRGEKLIFLVSDLDAWLRALPGPNAEDVSTHPNIPARITDTFFSEHHQDAPADPNASQPIPLTRGPRGHHVAPSVREQAR